MKIAVQSEPFDLGVESNAFASGHRDMGAIVTFTGVVRDLAQGDLDRMVIEHYPGMTQKALEAIAQDAQSRWNLGDVLVIHRYGDLAPGEMIMMIATASPHRKDAFEAAEFLMDYLKSRAPFWKKEITSEGADWVAAKDEDEDALSRW
ncbi:MAG: molybdenum cofactor biosynthesis protein MoaE [Shimia sp.]|jgi:molybdopterin synthase catalytic subunit|uniref:molybdenum cofactor biosynthesis protein MoaE n=1 Tax=Shimia sp. TaxID=1954381 RepID=UPI0040593A4E